VEFRLQANGINLSQRRRTIAHYQLVIANYFAGSLALFTCKTIGNDQLAIGHGLT
jgi:hypothetical protein